MFIIKLNFRCFICNKTEKLSVVSQKAIVDCFLNKGAIIVKGSTICKTHLNKKKLLKIEIPDPLYNHAEMSAEQINACLKSLRDEINKELNKKEGLNNSTPTTEKIFYSEPF